MSADFEIVAEPERDLVRITMCGLFTTQDIASFIVAREAAHAKLRCGPNRHLTLNDIREMKIQPQDSVAAFRQVLGDARYHSRRLAFVAARTLARSQLMRTLEGRDNVRAFESVTSAEAWLFAEDLQTLRNRPLAG
ncbi:hypothetical protein [Stakelama marina]|uniref:STAS/SEC14 domain-containing protein n=1 Tax=Stakelama marina TaxID=2826939 RepID=A0A8T4IFT4_9SPHN|nr:hypothetical protein [Stakelama marina]MBR0551119.1 hypothetical protein [Stakelama marina]